jgi:hypothetical protein
MHVWLMPSASSIHQITISITIFHHHTFPLLPSPRLVISSSATTLVVYLPLVPERNNALVSVDDPPPAHSLLGSSLDLSPDDLSNNMCGGDNILNIS